MLERVLEQQQALYAVLMEKKEKHVRALLPDAGEWGVIVTRSDKIGLIARQIMTIISKFEIL